MTFLHISLQALLVVLSILLVALVLLHKGSGGGLSDMFGGGSGANLGGSSRAMRNLNRITMTVAASWFAVIIGLGLVESLSS